MIEKEKEIKELYDLNHINDDKYKGYDYENNLYRKLLSPVLFNNPILNDFLMKLQKGSIWMIDSVLVIRNMFDPTVDKYDRHPN